MHKKMKWIAIVSVIISFVSIAVILGLSKFEMLTGVICGGLLSLGSYFLLMLIILKLKESPLLLLAAISIKLLSVGTLAILFVLIVKVSSTGFLIGLANLPLAIGFEGLLGVKSQDAN